MPPRKRAPSKAVVLRQSSEVARLPARRGGQNRIEILVQQGTTLLRNYQSVETSKTMILRELAKVVVELRSNFATEDGETDWTGRSHGYRETVATIYRNAGLPPDSADTIQAALRYHVGIVLREIAPPDELEDRGLLKETPRDRVRDTRERTAALAKTALAMQGKAKADPLRMVVSADTILDRVDLEECKNPDDVLEVLDSIGARVRDLKARCRRLL